MKIKTVQIGMGFRWELITDEGKRLAESCTLYSRRSDALRGAERAADSIYGCECIEVERSAA